MKLLISVLSCFVFINALVATPLLVECIQADGRYLLEILGHDPCHNPGYENPLAETDNSNPESILEAGGPADPCLDLLMDGSGCTRICSDALSSPPQTPERVTLRDPIGNGFADIGGNRKLMPEPIFLRDGAKLCHLTLRI